jgi:predicted PurR-regulated permease PerM
MSNDVSSDSSRQFIRNATAAALQIGALGLMLFWCFDIVKPFITLTLWALILAIAIHPFYLKCLHAMGGRVRLTSTLITLAMLLLLVVPSIVMVTVMVENTQAVAAEFQDGELQIPPPPSNVAEIPLVGKSLHKTWALASTNLAAALEQFSPQIKQLGSWLLVVAAGTGMGFVNFIFGIIIAGFLMASSATALQVANALTQRLLPESGPKLLDLAESTIRHVASGVIGVAFVQAVLVGLGLLVAGIPGAGLWTLLCLILGIIQIGVAPVMIGAVIYMWLDAATLPALLFTVWAIPVTFSDNFLRPLWMSRGLDVPITVILVGTIGGMLASGIVGMFVGAVLLAVGYKLFMAWLQTDIEPTTPEKN